MRKFFVNYTPYRGHENIRAIMEGSSYQAIVTMIRKTSKAATIFSIVEIPAGAREGVA